MKQDKFSNYGTLATQGSASLRRIPKKGKAGLAIAGLAAAGGLGVAGVKALKNRNKKANSLEGRLKKAQGQVASKINNTAIAKKMGVKVRKMK